MNELEQRVATVETRLEAAFALARQHELTQSVRAEMN